MKKIFVAAMAVAALCSATSLNAQNIKFGKVDYAELTAQMPEAESAKKELQTLYQDYSQRLEKIQQEMETIAVKLGNTGTTLPQAEIDDLSSQYRSLQSRGTEMQTVAQNVLTQKEEELFGAIRTKVGAAVEKVAKASSITIVFDPAEGVIVYFDPAHVTDLTPLVKKELGLK